MSQPVIAVVGRPNVGKSTLVNRIIGRREAIVQELPGVTRDRVLYHAEWQGRNFLVIDTGGLESDPADELAHKVAERATAAATEADVIVFVVDASGEPTLEDRQVAEVVRRLGRPVVLVANKADNPNRDLASTGFFELGLGQPYPVSALHGRGAGDLLDTILRALPPEPEESPPTDEPSIAIVGRPNVGKSSLFNRLSGTETSIVHDAPGTTRDSVDSVVELNGTRYRFIDTAGMRRNAKIDDTTEYYSTVRAMRSLDRCDIAMLVIDDAEGIARQDMRIAETIVTQGRSAIIVLNKVDLVSSDIRTIEREEVRRRLPHLYFAPMIETSAVTGAGLNEIAPTLERIMAGRDVRIPTPLLNAVIDDLQSRTPIPSSKPGARVKYATQAETSPPTIVLFGAGRVPKQWLRHVERSLRRRFGFEGTPIRMLTRNPRDEQRRERKRS